MNDGGYEEARINRVNPEAYITKMFEHLTYP
jgi:hypothetical protein